VVEFIHAGSLVVEDIEDGSRIRRGRVALHVRYGMPVALNAGNWLYFWPFELLKKCVYAINFFLPLGFCVLNGYWIAVFAGIGAAVAAFLVFGSGREGVPLTAGRIGGTIYPTPRFLGAGPGCVCR
jgi:hypothetical protein